jgi:hypothetical protein
MAQIGSIDGSPVYESIGDVQDLSQPWFVAPPEDAACELCTTGPAVVEGGWPAGWVGIGATED